MPVETLTESEENCRGWAPGGGSDDNTARLWDLKAKDPAASRIVLRGHDSFSARAISPDSHWLVTAGEDKTVRLWDLKAKDPAASLVTLPGHDGRIYSAAVSADNPWLVSDVIVDTGSSAFVPLLHYVVSSEVQAILSERGHQLVVHTIVTGGQALLDTLHGSAQLVKQLDAVRFVIWLNPFWGPFADNGRSFEQMNLYGRQDSSRNHHFPAGVHR